MNPVGVAAGVEYAGDQPILVEFAIVEHIGGGAKNAYAPTCGREWKASGLVSSRTMIRSYSARMDSAFVRERGRW